MLAAADATPIMPGASLAPRGDLSGAGSDRAVDADGPQHARVDPTRVAAALEAFVEHLEEGVAVIATCGRVLFLNCAARAMVRGVPLRLVNGHLRASVPNDTAALRKMVSGCTLNGGDSIRLVSEDRTLLIAASALAPITFAPAESAVLLRLIDPAAIRLPRQEMLQVQFGLTPAEAAFALEMLAGNDLVASATRRGIALNTARAHLRRIFDKTETRRQAALMRLLLLCPQPVMRQV
jgi:DNA-binding CsgD family transcriptional regulator